jgi:hypothetical protein
MQGCGIQLTPRVSPITMEQLKNIAYGNGKRVKETQNKSEG